MYIILCTYIIIHMQANRQIQNYQAFVLFKKRKTAAASGLIRRMRFSAIFLVRLLHAPISRARRKAKSCGLPVTRSTACARVKVRGRVCLRRSTRPPARARPPPRARRCTAGSSAAPCGKGHGTVPGCPGAPPPAGQYTPSARSHVHRGAQRRVAALHAPLAAVINAGHAGHAEQYPVEPPTDALCSLKSWPRALHHGYPQRTAEAGPYTASTPRGRAAAPGCGQSQTGSWNRKLKYSPL